MVIAPIALTATIGAEMNLSALDPVSVRTRLEKKENLPTLPNIFSYLVQLAADPHASLHEMAQIIACDPVVTSSVLRIANSSYMGLKSPVEDLPNAVLYLGIGEIRRAALAVKSCEVFTGHGGQPDEFIRRIWLHSLSTGFISRALAGQAGFEFGEEAYVAGLLHDLGKLFFATSYPKVYAALRSEVAAGNGNGLDLEKYIFGFTHVDAGKVLATHWKLPHNLREVIGHHHTPTLLQDESRHLAMCVASCNILAHQMLSDEPTDNMLPTVEEWLTELAEVAPRPKAFGEAELQELLKDEMERVMLYEGE